MHTSTDGALTIRWALEGLGNVHQVHGICLDAVASALNLQSKIVGSRHINESKQHCRYHMGETVLIM
jgi:hypothetical protein